MNDINNQLEFKATIEVNKSNYLDLTNTRNANSMELSIYRKPTNANITIQYTSNHPWEHKKAAFTHYINRAITLPITEQARKQEWQNICNIAQRNGFPRKVIEHIREKETARLNERATEQKQHKSNKNG
jgi:phosphatidate phosphatase APP1